MSTQYPSSGGGYTGARWKLRVRFEWNDAKTAANLGKHGVSFDKAASVFSDLLSATGDDPDFSLSERRFATFGLSSAGRLIAVAHAEPDDTIRIVSGARDPDRKEVVKNAKKPASEELRPEYVRADFGALVRGKYVDRLRKNSNMVVLDPEVSDLCPNEAAVNEALRSLAEIAKRAGSQRRR